MSQVASPLHSTSPVVADRPSGARPIGESVPTEIAGRFILKSEIGRGGMCAVYRAEHRYSRRAVAVKLLLPKRARQPDMQARLLREAVALGRIRHENVLQILDAGVDGDHPFLVLELMEGRTLDGIITSRGFLPVGETVHIVRRIASAIEAAHRLGIIHRDVKPENVFVAQGQGTDIVKLGDFGLAHTPNDSAGAPRLTGHGVILGTPEYMSPDQLLSKPATPKADIWALGILLHECLTGRVPYSGNYYDVLLQTATATTPPVGEFGNEIPAPLVAIINRALSQNEREQFATASELIAALDATNMACEELHVLSSAAKARRESVVEAPKRAFTRAPFVTPIRIDSQGGSLEGQCQNISAGGMMILMHKDLPLGTTLEVRFSLPGSGRVAICPATVRWSKKCDPNSRHRYALGLEYFYLDGRVDAEIRQYIELMGEDTTP